MNRIQVVHITVLLSVIIATLTSCTTSQSVVSQSANLNKYNYASLIDVMSYTGDASLMDAEIIIYNALENSRLQMVGDKRIDDLSPSQKGQLLLVRFGVTQNNDVSTVTVNFTDYMTGKPVASCRGSLGISLDSHLDIEIAFKEVAKQIQKTFPSK